MAPRLSPSTRGYDRAWARLRLVVLAGEPLCRRCYADGRLTPAEQVHHVIPIGTRPDLRMVLSNLEPLFARCHSAHTAAEQRRGVVGP